MSPMLAIAMAHWQSLAAAMAVYPRAWISASSPWLVGSPLNAMTIGTVDVARPNGS